MGTEPSQSKTVIFKAIERCAPTLAALYPRSVLVAAFLDIDDRARVVRDFMSECTIEYPIVRNQIGEVDRSVPIA